MHRSSFVCTDFYTEQIPPRPSSIWIELYVDRPSCFWHEVFLDRLSSIWISIYLQRGLSGITEFHLDQISSQTCFLWTHPVSSRPSFIEPTEYYLSRVLSGHIEFLSGSTELHLDRVLYCRPSFIWTVFHLDRVSSRRPCVIRTDRVISRPSYISTKFYLVNRVLSGRPSFIWTDRVLSRPSFILSSKFYHGRRSFISTELYFDRVLSR